MPFENQTAGEYTRPLKISWNGGVGDLNLRYKPMPFNGKGQAEYAAMVTAGQSAEALYYWIAGTITEWDVVDHGKPVKIRQPDIEVVNYSVLQEIRARVFGDENILPLSGPTSRNGLSLVESEVS